MGSRNLVSTEVLQELTNKIQEIVNNYCWNLEYFTPTEVEGFFDGTQQEIDYYSSIIKDDVISKNFLHSSKQIADDIAKSILEANEYTDSLLKNISTIQLKYVTSLPTSDISENTIYILKASDGSSKDTLNLYNATDGWTSIGEFTIDLTNYIDRTTYDTDMDLKANKTEVVANDKIVQTLDSTTNSSDTVLSTSGLQVELNKKANDDEVIKKTDITTTIDSTSTDSELPTAKTIYEKTKNMCTTSVKDIPKTVITFTDTTHFEQFDTAVENGYQVKNGICYVNLNIKCNSTSTNGFNIKFGMPKPNFSIVHGTIISFAPSGTGFKKELTFSINSNGVMTLFGGEPGCRYLGTFSYPVLES